MLVVRLVGVVGSKSICPLQGADQGYYVHGGHEISDVVDPVVCGRREAAVLAYQHGEVIVLGVAADLLVFVVVDAGDAGSRSLPLPTQSRGARQASERPCHATFGAASQGRGAATMQSKTAAGGGRHRTALTLDGAPEAPLRNIG